jgi:8-oxo-dGTP diphosphatase
VANRCRKGHSPQRERLVPRPFPALGCGARRHQADWLPQADGTGLRTASRSAAPRALVARVVLGLVSVTASQALGVPREAQPGAHTRADRYRPVLDVYVLLRRPDGMILLLERSGTGYADGQLCPPSGHLEDGESVARSAVREAAEETGVGIDPAGLVFTHVVHHRNPEGQGRVGFFFTVTRWAGEPVNREPHKCAGLRWVLRGSHDVVPCCAA